MSHAYVAFVASMAIAFGIIYDIRFASPNENRILDDFVNTICITGMIVFIVNAADWICFQFFGFGLL